VVCYFTHLVHVLFVNVGSEIVIKKMNFSFLGSVFQYCSLGLNVILIEVRIIFNHTFPSNLDIMTI
jgi:hypothetical protein